MQSGHQNTTSQTRRPIDHRPVEHLWRGGAGPRVVGGGPGRMRTDPLHIRDSDRDRVVTLRRASQEDHPTKSGEAARVSPEDRLPAPRVLEPPPVAGLH
jgi:hypothetical protein